MSLLLPVSHEPVQASDPDATAPAEFMPLRVLFVEDDLLVSSVVVPALRAAGHTVRHCLNGEAAQRALHDGGLFDIVFTDVVMPGTLSGLDLAAWCQDADFLVHDAQYSREEYKTHAGFGHSTYEEALSLAEQAGVQQLAFFHHDPAHSDADIDALIEEALGNHRQSGGTDVVAFPAAEDQELLL